MHVLGLIPARGGSKQIPRKNIRLLRGRPLLAYTAEVALASARLRRVVLSTDDDEIAEVAKDLGLEVPFFRPPELARDETPTVQVAQHAIRTLEEAGDRYDAVCLLQPTSPLRSTEDVDGAIDLMERTDASSVISMVDVGEKHPARMKLVAEDRRIVNPPFAESEEGMPRQRLEPMYLRAGSIYLARRWLLVERGTFQGPDCRAWIVAPERAVNLDGPLDWRIAECLLGGRR